MQPIVRRVLAVAWLVWLLDSLSKNLAQRFLEGSEHKPLIGNFLKLSFTKNSGAAFSFVENGSVLLAAFAILAIFVIAYWTPKINSIAWAIVFGLVLGGTLGNLTDRVFRSGSGFLNGKVIDWIELPHWPIFNLADSAIVVAALLATGLSIRNISPISRPGTDSKPDKEPDLHA